MEQNDELAPQDDQGERIETIICMGETMANCIIDRTRKSREQSLALTRLEEAIMWAFASIANE